MLKRLGVGALVLALAACGGSNTTDNFAAATPDVAGLALETSGGASDGLALRADGLGSTASALTAVTTSSCQPWQFLCRIREGVKGINQYVRAVVEPVEALAQTKPASETADTRVYGPIDAPATSPVATFRLTVKRDVDADTFKWKLEGKSVGTDDSKYVVVLAGKLKKGELPHRGRGVLAIDLTKLSALNQSGLPVDGFKGAGQVLVSFAHVGQAKSLAYVLKGFIPDTTVAGATPLDAAFVGHKTPSGEARVRLASVDEYLAPNPGLVLVPADAGPELLLARARWVPGLGGRAAVLVKDTVSPGDVATYGPSATIPFVPDFFLGVSCFDKDELEGYHRLFACTKTPAAGTAPCKNVTPPSWPAGSITACLPSTDIDGAGTPEDQAPPADDKSSTAPEPDAPAVPDAAPASMDDVKF
jgi:hypothetical protein